jgi:hypothetical protein
VTYLGLPVPIPNPPARHRLVPYHDVHHILGGFQTDERGEALVSAWTLGTGRGPWLGHAYDLVAVVPGFWLAPRGSWAAFLRGRRGRNLYDEPLDALLDRDLQDLAVEAGWTAPTPTTRPSDIGAACWLAVELVLTWVLPTAPLVLAVLTAHDLCTRGRVHRVPRHKPSA